MNRLGTIGLITVLASGTALSAERARSTLTSRSPQVVGAVSHLLLPTSASNPGRFGAFYKTKVSIFNATSYAYDIRAGFSQGTGEVAAAFFEIGPGETVTFDDFIYQVFGRSGGGAIDLDSGDDRYVFIVNAEVYTESSAGRFTTSVQFGDELANIVPSRPGFAVGISVDGFNRTNVGCASNSASYQTVTVQAFDASNFAVGNPFTFELAPFGWAQYAINVGMTNGGIRMDATQNAVCFAVEVNNVSNDGTFQLAVPF